MKKLKKRLLHRKQILSPKKKSHQRKNKMVLPLNKCPILCMDGCLNKKSTQNRSKFYQFVYVPYNPQNLTNSSEEIDLDSQTAYEFGESTLKFFYASNNKGLCPRVLYFLPTNSIYIENTLSYYVPAIVKKKIKKYISKSLLIVIIC